MKKQFYKGGVGVGGGVGRTGGVFISCLSFAVAVAFLSLLCSSTLNHLDDPSASSTTSQPTAEVITQAEKHELRDKVVEMFDHAFGSYMTYAFPADELMPLSC